MFVQDTQRMSQLSIIDQSGIEQLVPGHMKTLSISDQAGNVLFNWVGRDEDTIKKIDNIFSIAKKSGVKGAGGLEAAFVVVRTDNWKDFLKDLFLPMFVNHVLKIDRIASKIIAALPALAFDLLTLVPRILILPFRAIYLNRLPSQANPLSQYILENVANEERERALAAIQKGLITIKLRDETVHLEQAESSLKATQRITLNSFLIVVKKLPGNQHFFGCGDAENVYLRFPFSNNWVLFSGEGIGDPSISLTRSGNSF